MHTSSQLSKHLSEVFTGGNWTTVNVKQVLYSVSWQQAITQIQSFNSIGALTFHIHYYVQAQLQVFNGNPLSAHDKYSYDIPPLTNELDWQMLITQVLTDAKKLCSLIEQFPNNGWDAPFTDEKYGTYYRNVLGLIEHTHYHLGQIVILKKMMSI
jgi:hypothetical protein